MEIETDIIAIKNLSNISNNSYSQELKKQKTKLLENMEFKNEYTKSLEYQSIINFINSINEQFILNEILNDTNNNQGKREELLLVLSIISILIKSKLIDNLSDDSNIILNKLLKILNLLNLDYSSYKNKLFEYSSIIITELCESTINIEKLYSNNLINTLDKYIKTDISCKYIFKLMTVIAGNSYYKVLMLKNINLIKTLSDKFIKSDNIYLSHYLLASLNILITDKNDFYNDKVEIPFSILEKLEGVVMFQNDDDKITAISILFKILTSNNYSIAYKESNYNNHNNKFSVNIDNMKIRIFNSSIYVLVKILEKYNNSPLNADLSEYLKQESFMKIESSDLSNYNSNCNQNKYRKEEISLKIKNRINFILILAKLLNNNKDLQSLFKNIEGIDFIFKEYKNSILDSNLKEADEFITKLKKESKDKPKIPTVRKSSINSTSNITNINVVNVNNLSNITNINVVNVNNLSNISMGVDKNDNSNKESFYTRLINSTEPISNPFNLFSKFFLEREYYNDKNSIPELILNYKTAITVLLAYSCSECEDSREKIAKSSDLKQILHQVQEKQVNNNLSLAFFLLSLGRIDSSTKKQLFQIEVHQIIYRLICFNDNLVQLLSISALCNYLINSSNLNSDEIEYIIDLLVSIIQEKKKSKFTFYSLYALKNLAYNCFDNKEILNYLIKKLTFERILEQLEDEDYSIQEQTLILLRCISHSSSVNDKDKEDIIISTTKCTKLCKKIADMIENCIKKIGIGAAIDKKNRRNSVNNNNSSSLNVLLNSKTEDNNEKEKDCCLFNMSIAMYVLINIYVVDEKHNKIIKECGVFKNISSLLKYNDSKLNISCLYFIRGVLKSDKKAVQDMNLVHIIESIFFIEDKESESGKLAYEILEEIK